MYLKNELHTKGRAGGSFAIFVVSHGMGVRINLGNETNPDREMTFTADEFAVFLKVLQAHGENVAKGL